ncbi:MAG: BON domain-containing protein [Pseudomonas sp.]|uniref:BON domain-containing protein n=1 Tax=Pseudomonas sp. TaxID=306 RepID=UPI00339783A2
MPFNKLIIAATAASALSLGVAPVVFAASNGQAPLMVAANAVENTEEVVTDTWITSKVKSSFVADDSLSALDIKVETNKGVVSLSGVVASDAERDLAVSTAKAIKGVQAVSADGLKSAD